MGLKIITEPTSEPITLEEARTHLGLTAYDSDGHPHDAMVQGFVTAARTWTEEFTGLSLAIKTYELALDEFPEDEIELPMGPVVEIESVTYVAEVTDSDGVAQYEVTTIDPANYVLDSYQKPSWLLPAVSFDWPTAASVINAVKIQYRAGYVTEFTSEEEAANVLPGAIKAALFVLLSEFYDKRGTLTALPMAVESLLRPYRVKLGMA